MNSTNTLTLGECTNRDLLQELVDRGVIKKIIGDERLRKGADVGESRDFTIREDMRADQEQRVKELLA